jgi:hypothetical protein
MSDHCDLPLVAFVRQVWHAATREAVLAMLLLERRGQCSFVANSLIIPGANPTTFECTATTPVL